MSLVSDEGHDRVDTHLTQSTGVDATQSGDAFEIYREKTDGHASGNAEEQSSKEGNTVNLLPDLTVEVAFTQEVGDGIPPLTASGALAIFEKDADDVAHLNYDTQSLETPQSPEVDFEVSNKVQSVIDSAIDLLDTNGAEMPDMAVEVLVPSGSAIGDAELLHKDERITVLEAVIEDTPADTIESVDASGAQKPFQELLEATVSSDSLEEKMELASSLENGFLEHETLPESLCVSDITPEPAPFTEVDEHTQNVEEMSFAPVNGADQQPSDYGGSSSAEHTGAQDDTDGLGPIAVNEPNSVSASPDEVSISADELSQPTESAASPSLADTVKSSTTVEVQDLEVEVPLSAAESSADSVLPDAAIISQEKKDVKEHSAHGRNDTPNEHESSEANDSQAILAAIGMGSSFPNQEPDVDLPLVSSSGNDTLCANLEESDVQSSGLDQTGDELESSTFTTEIVAIPGTEDFIESDAPVDPMSLTEQTDDQQRNLVQPALFEPSVSPRDPVADDSQDLTLVELDAATDGKVDGQGANDNFTTEAVETAPTPTFVEMEDVSGAEPGQVMDATADIANAEHVLTVPVVVMETDASLQESFANSDSLEDTPPEAESVTDTLTVDTAIEIERPKSPWTPSYSVVVLQPESSESDQHEDEVIGTQETIAAADVTSPADQLVDDMEEPVIVPTLVLESASETVQDSSNDTDSSVLIDETSVGPVVDEVSLLPEEHEPRPKSPWTPSYSVTTQGVEHKHSEELDQLEPLPPTTVLSADLAVAADGAVLEPVTLTLEMAAGESPKDVADVPESITVEANEISSALPAAEVAPSVSSLAEPSTEPADTESEALANIQETTVDGPVLDSFLVPSEDEQEPRPKSPWTPSYSVTVQGPESQSPEDLNELRQLPASVIQSVDTIESTTVADEAIFNDVADESIVAVEASEISALTTDISPSVVSHDENAETPSLALFTESLQPNGGVTFLHPSEDDLESRPKSPWTPSYSVNTQGPDSHVPKESDQADELTDAVDGFEILTVSSTKEVSLSLVASPEETAGVPSPEVLADNQEASVDRAFLGPSQDDLEPRPKSPWTPSYSVMTQGPDSPIIQQLEELLQPSASIDESVDQAKEQSEEQDSVRDDVDCEQAGSDSLPSAVTTESAPTIVVEDTKELLVTPDVILETVSEAVEDVSNEVELVNQTIIQGTDEGPSLLPEEHEPQPRSPSTPSYSVTTQGPERSAVEELDQLEKLPASFVQLTDQGIARLEDDVAGDMTSTPAKDNDIISAVSVVASPTVPKDIEEHVVVPTLALESSSEPAEDVTEKEPIIQFSTIDGGASLLPEEHEPGPISPWTPSYAVTVQGPEIQPSEELDQLEQSSPDITLSAEDKVSFEEKVPIAEEKDCVLVETEHIPSYAATELVSLTKAGDAEEQAIMPTVILETLSEPVKESLPHVENIELAASVGDMKSLLPEEQDPRPKSPWTPSYSVTLQGFEPPHSEELDQLDQLPPSIVFTGEPSSQDVRENLPPAVPETDVSIQHSDVAGEPVAAVEVSDMSAGRALPSIIAPMPKEVTNASSAIPAWHQGNTVDIALLGPSVDDLEQRPESPWTPSYSVIMQGPDTHSPEKLDELEQLPPSVVQSTKPVELAGPGVQDVSNDVLDESAIAVGVDEIFASGEHVPPSVIVSSEGDVNAPSLVVVTENSESYDDMTTIHLSEDNLEPRPKSPWTPSYSVMTQGPDSRPLEEPDPMEQLAASIIQSVQAVETTDVVFEDISYDAKDESMAPLEVDGTMMSAKEASLSNLALPEDNTKPVVLSEEQKITVNTSFLGPTQGDLEPRPKSPWTPSYSVTTQGPEVYSPEELDQLEQLPEPAILSVEQDASPVLHEAADAGFPTIITDVVDEEALQTTVEAEAETEVSTVEINSVFDRGLISPEDASVPERPKSPWTPSYSVIKQGPGPNSELDGLEQLPPSVVLSVDGSVVQPDGSLAEVQDTKVQSVEQDLSLVPQEAVDADVPTIITDIVDEGLQQGTVEAEAETEISALGANSPSDNGLAPPDVPERPKSPWTPSYSVITQGPGQSNELDELEQLPPSLVLSVNGFAVQDSKILSEAPLISQDQDTKMTSDVKPSAASATANVAQSDEAAMDLHTGDAETEAFDQATSTLTPREDTLTPERPKSPWIPSFSVETQGLGLQHNGHVVNEQDDGVRQEPSDDSPKLVAQDDEITSGEITPTPKFPAIHESHERSSAEEHGDDDRVGNGETSYAGRKRLESTTSSRFFPGGWFSNAPPPAEEGMTSVDIATVAGEFTSSRSLDTSPIEDKSSKARWCIIM